MTSETKQTKGPFDDLRDRVDRAIAEMGEIVAAAAKITPRDAEKYGNKESAEMLGELQVSVQRVESLAQTLRANLVGLAIPAIHKHQSGQPKGLLDFLVNRGDEDCGNPLCPRHGSRRKADDN